ncbi:putative transmembrane protein [Toxoplasma gondii TgCatPRC2]|uniref:Transmembrane protein n=15 Tax=Toxoplasma gondii TaxID=5811 RepID=A0A125YY06_TOXGG|nr:hypothetical protein TGME49_307605 [Toxoplasma gondii ME49]EPR56921.1 hypothetical protein TGGT1_307605 [Toxoplasma gondii GT1]ESS29099.1 putative transmembrane protein [Toxoplasma gondii VEG]KAF4644666.1 hypothetical protein TGRH88_016600 [Toxoplasma gondii]KFG27829.1 putative transmembrane protein [Toxoplasma gondii p89]KFG29458.1 putative transmembrane protein [Toxoplasma gondii GAB2-2007-GAL-DOM2]KFG32017.1 putative transmembrane protein [Toxoplasma gondii FOU]KFG59201.1 putative tran|eukprot:XP_018636199.1 hypothetical protein TGME49_307605 [Toxoplasma gondii ME49]
MQVTTFLQTVIFLPVGSFLLLTSLLGVRILNSLTSRICRQTISLGYINLRLVSLILLISVSFFAREQAVLTRIYTSPAYAQYCGTAEPGNPFPPDSRKDPVTAAASAAAAQAAAAALSGGEAGLQCMAYKLRHERNWWLSLLSLTVWLLLWRVTAMVAHYDTQLLTLEDERVHELSVLESTKGGGLNKGGVSSDRGAQGENKS